MFQFEFFQDFQGINLGSIRTISLVKWIRARWPIPLSSALAMARAIKEAHRLGVIHGRITK